MREIVVANDARTARRTAADLLAHATVLSESPEDGGALSLRRRAAWIGTHSALGAHGVTRDAEVTAADLALALTGRNVRNEKPVMMTHPVPPDEHAVDLPARPGGARVARSTSAKLNVGLSFAAPDGLAKAWREQPERRAAIERAMLASAEAALEHMRRTTPLVANTSSDVSADRGYVHALRQSYAHGFAAAAFLHVPEADDARLRVDVVLLGVERWNGTLVRPVMGAVEAAEPAAERAAREALRAELTAERAAGPQDAYRRLREDLLVLEGRLNHIPRAGTAQLTLELAWSAQRERTVRAKPGTEAASGRDSAEPPPGVVRIDRADVSVPTTLDRLRGAIGARLADDLARHARPLADWLEHHPDAWVRARHAELGDPSAGLDRGAALELQRIHAARDANVDQLRGLYEQNDRAGGFMDHVEQADDFEELVEASGLSEAEVRQFNVHSRAIFSLDQQEERLVAEGRHPGAWAADIDRVVRAIAYADEVAIRREIEIRQQVEHSVANPGEHLTELLGAAPDRAAPERAEWEALVRDIEYVRIADAADLRDGVTPSTRRDARAQRQLDDRIDRLRASRDLPPLAPETGIDLDGFGM